MQNLSNLHKEYKESLLKAIDHLEYSYKKVLTLPTNPEKLDEETLETWESFSSRFARCIDLFTSKYVISYVKLDDPGFEGSLRDHVNQAEKLELIQSADAWMIARGLRNITAHEYKNSSLEVFFKDLLAFTPQIIALKDKV